MAALAWAGQPTSPSSTPSSSGPTTSPQAAPKAAIRPSMGGSLKVLSWRLSSVERSFIAARSDAFAWSEVHSANWRAPAHCHAEPIRCHPEPIRCHPESFAVILSEAKNLALPAQDKLREGSPQAVSRQENPERDSSLRSAALRMTPV